MKLFFLKVAVLCLPFVLALGFPTLVLWGSGEFMSAEQMVKSQLTGTQRFGLAYSNPDPEFKLKMTLARRPRVLILGTSRVLQFRARFFKDPDEVYNAGRGVRFLYQMEDFLRAIPNSQTPAVVILGLEQCDFNARYKAEQFDRREPSFDPRPKEPLRIIQEHWLDVYRHHAQGKIAVKPVLAGVLPFSQRSTQVGVMANQVAQGYAPDGAYEGQEPDADLGKRFAETRERIPQGSSRFEHGSRASPARIEVLRSLLAYCKKRNIHVVAFLPPLPHELVELMRAGPYDYGYFFNLERDLRPYFEEHRFTLCDYSDLAVLDASDYETLDGLHASEKAYLRILIRLAEEDARLRARVDRDRLRDLLARTPGHLSVVQD